jgi:hypothetical protein
MPGQVPLNLYPRVDAEIITALRPALWLAGAGWLIILVDISFGTLGVSGLGVGRSMLLGWQLDLVHDSLGYLLVLLALGQLRRAPAPERATRFVPAIAVVSLAGVAFSLVGTFVAWRSGVVGVVFALFQVCATLAIVAFLWTLVELSCAAMERTLERAWRRATLAAAIVWALPVCALSLAGVIFIVAGFGSQRVHVGAAGQTCAVLVIWALPLLWIGAAFFMTSGWAAPLRLTNCHVCGYPVADLPRPQCPECGTVFATDRGSARPGEPSASGDERLDAMD